jgi:hypothetical protein
MTQNLTGWPVKSPDAISTIGSEALLQPVFTSTFPAEAIWVTRYVRANEDGILGLIGVGAYE